MVSFLDRVLGGIRVMVLIKGTGCLFESLEYVWCVVDHTVYHFGRVNFVPL